MKSYPKSISVAFDKQIESKQSHGGITRYIRDLETTLAVFHGVRVVSKKDASLIHASFYTGRPKRLPGQRLITTLYDMTPELCPDMFPLGKLRLKFRLGSHANKRSWLANSDAIVSISNTSACDLRNVWPEIQVPIHTIHLGTNIQAIQPKTLSSLDGRRFWLLVGKRSGYKNGLMMLESMRSVLDYSDAPLLVAAGGGSWSRQELRLIEEYKLSHLVRQYQVSDAELAWLYRRCEAVFIPSHAEGFSLPLIESLCCNAPCIASEISVHAEVGGAFAQLLPSKSKSEWMEMLADIHQKPLPTPKNQLGEQNWTHLAERYSLCRMAKEHAELYHTLIQ